MAVARNQQSNAALEVAKSIDRAWALIQHKRGEDAWRLLLKAKATAQAAQIKSAFLAWGLAVAADIRGDAEHAVEYILKAVELEPCSTAIRGSHGIILKRTQVSFADLPPWDPEVSRLFGLLQKLDAVDAAAAEKYSLGLLAHGHLDDALAWAEVSVTIEPPTPERLRHLVRLLERAGRAEEARARRNEADCLAATFPVPEAQA